MSTTTTTADIIRASFKAWETNDRVAIEALIADDFTFTSPNDGDDHLNRAEYFEKCWVNSGQIEKIDILNLVDNGDEAFARYVATLEDGNRFNNAEFFTLRDGKIRSVDVYFGRTL
ncbi:MAG: nuclear transport factor 2 family protein [Aggregatilineales bacterium]